MGPKKMNLSLGPLPAAPCAVAPDQLEDASVCEYCREEVGEGGAFWHHRCRFLYYWGGNRWAARGGLARGRTIGAPVWGPLEGYLGRH